jgi:ankyrin repeat protein
MKSDPEEYTPLHVACAVGSFDTVSTLLGSPQVNINALDRNGETPLDLALEKNHMQVAELLIINGGIQNKNQCIVPIAVPSNNQKK